MSVEIHKVAEDGMDDIVIRTDVEGGRTYRVRATSTDDATPRLVAHVVQGMSNITPDKCLGCAEGVWHSEAYHFKELTREHTPQQLEQIRLFNARNNDRPWSGSEGVIEVLDVRIVAVRAGDGSWAAYWQSLGPSHEGSYAIQGTLGPDPESIASGGHKVSSNQARFGFFPNIVGDYRK